MSYRPRKSSDFIFHRCLHFVTICQVLNKKNTVIIWLLLSEMLKDEMPAVSLDSIIYANLKLKRYSQGVTTAGWTGES